MKEILKPGNQVRVHLQGTPARYTCRVHLQGTPARYTCKVHLQGTPARYTCKVHLQGKWRRAVVSKHLPEPISYKVEMMERDTVEIGCTYTATMAYQWHDASCFVQCKRQLRTMSMTRPRQLEILRDHLRSVNHHNHLR